MLIFLCLLTNLSFLQNADSTKKQESPIFENSTILINEIAEKTQSTNTGCKTRVLKKK
jgi:hypothetical protein